MQSKSHKTVELWLDQSQIRSNNILDSDLTHSRYDFVRLGYWVPKGSPDEIMLTLKGLTLRKLYYDNNNTPPKISSFIKGSIGSNDNSTVGGSSKSDKPKSITRLTIAKTPKTNTISRFNG